MLLEGYELSEFYLNWFTSDQKFPFFIQYGFHDNNTDLHRHVDFSELVIVLSGTATHIVNTEESFIKKGNVFVINGSTPHAFKDPQDFKICNIMYKPEMLSTAGSDLRTSNGFQALFVLEPLYRHKHAYTSKLSLPIPMLEFVTALIAGMIEEYSHKLQGFQTLLVSRFMELVVYLSRHYEKQDKGSQDNHLIHLAKSLSFMEDHYLEALSLDQIAAHSGISVRHLNRIFRSYYQTTPISYLHRLRLERACSLLKHSNFSITQISHESGFSDSNYFTRQFTKTYGMSPKAYRKKP